MTKDSLRYIFRIAFFAMLLTVPNHSFAKQKWPYIYLNLGYGFGSVYMNKAAIDIVYKRHCLSIANYYCEKDATEFPQDYTNIHDYAPGTRLDGWSIMYGRNWHTTHPYVRLCMKGGILWGSYTTPVNFVLHPGTGFLSFGPYYTHDEKVEKTGGIILNPEIESPTRYVGLSLGCYAILCDKTSCGGLSINLLLGRLRKKLHTITATRNNYETTDTHAFTGNILP